MTQPAPGDWRGRLRAANVQALALLPLRLFLGVTYVYAGVDKLASPHFLAAGDAFSVAAQLAGYARTSPLAPLIDAAMPIAIPIGLLIALAELAIGIGLLTGLAFRLAAGAGTALSLLFWLTASWSITPYFFSPDLPYTFGFLTLALAGHGGMLAWTPFSRRGELGGDSRAEAAAPEANARLLDRRSILRVSVLAVLTVLAAAAAASLRILSGASQGSGGQAVASPAPSRSPSPTPSPAPTASPAPTSSSAAPSATAIASAASPAATDAATASPVASAAPATSSASSAPAATGPVIGSLADFASANSVPFTVPNQVPFAMGPGGPGIMVKLADGRVTAFNAVCTHGHCTVGFDQANMVIACPCHLATYDPAHGAAVLSGPAPLPLPEIPVAVDAGGQIHVTATD